MKNPNSIPIRGDNTMKKAIFRIPVAKIESLPKTNQTGPIKPPINACETLIGNPKCVQKYTHNTAPINADKIRYGFTIAGSTMPFPIVFATCIPNIKTAEKFQKAAQKTAAVGESTFVETIVAIEFAASFIPLRKSNSSAKITPIITITNIYLLLC